MPDSGVNLSRLQRPTLLVKEIDNEDGSSFQEDTGNVIKKNLVESPFKQSANHDQSIRIKRFVDQSNKHQVKDFVDDYESFLGSK